MNTLLEIITMLFIESSLNILHVYGDRFLLGGLTWTGISIPLESPAVPYSSPVASEDSMTIMESARQFTLALDSLKQVLTYAFVP